MRRERLPGSRGCHPILAALMLAACGGGGGDVVEPTARSRETALATGPAFFPSTPIPIDAHLKGMWSPVYDWPLIPIHTLLLPDGRVLSYGSNADGTQTGNFIYDLWDGAGAPDVGHSTLLNGSGTDLFCSSQLLLPGSGNVLLAGGDNWNGTKTTNGGNNNSNVIDTATGAITRGLNMNRRRWYSTATTLTNGETYIQGGASGTDRPEIRALDGTFRLLGADTSTLTYYYPRNFVAPNGRVFGYDIEGRSYYVNPADGTIALGAQFPAGYFGSGAGAAMFRPGRILQMVGAAAVIDINGATPTFTPTQSLSSQRTYVNATILADGQVLATGGSGATNQLVGVNNTAEIWNPQTGQWLRGAVGARARLYHSNALLLPDASVLVGGGGAPGPLVNTNVELYYPPYLFTAGGQRAARPSITLAPSALTIGKTFDITVASASGVSRVTLVKTGSTTHSWNMEQRFMDLTFAVQGSSVAVQAPTRAVDAPPGYYQLFVFNGAGVPSVSHILKIGIAANPSPQLTPVLTNPGNRSSVTSSATSLQLAASDPNGDTLRYSASGLPPGLSINAGSGLIGGTPSTAGSYNVVVSASDGINAASANFVWSVTNGSSPLAFNSLSVPSPVPTNGSASYTASASGSNVRYRWDFGDGSAPTAWSSSPDVLHAFTRAGTFTVTVTITDDGNQQQSRSFVQVVHLPVGASRPSSSGNLALDAPSSGNPRLWVVNPDNDSVTAFDSITRAKLGETPVGTAPRAVAVARDGKVWVSNRQSGTISVIDPASRAVTRTIALPRASMPYGIAMSPTANHAFVVLEATGQLLKFDTASYAQLGSAANLGANVRHVSVNAGGSTAYVTRFITKPLPGEATALVAPTATTGGEVLQIDTASMGVVRTIVLKNSTRPDFETQGRGIPNYLGAAAISPDGTQAWVPSKQDNVQRGALRDGNALNFQNTVRAISSRVVLASGTEDLAARIDHDNASLASAALFDRLGVFLFVALETSREVAVVNAHDGEEVLRFDVGRAPQGLALSADGTQLYVHNFMDRSVSVFDVTAIVRRGEAVATPLATLSSVAADKLPAQVLQGKRLFYDARDTRLARDSYVSCATCHNDGGHDGRVWDLTGFGEGLRNTISLRGRAGGHGKLHWSHNFDEVQDFEGQIRNLAGGTGLMSDADFFAGTRSQPLGTAKAGISADLDALAAYVKSLTRFDDTPYRPSATTLSAQAAAGRSVFANRNCQNCHNGSPFTLLGPGLQADIGTIKPSSGKRLGAALTTIDTPTLRDVWATAPYLHDGSAPTLAAAVLAHRNTVIGDADLAALTQYLREIGREEPSAPVRAPSNNGTGLLGSYFANTTLAGAPVFTRTEGVNFDWVAASPGTGVPVDNFSVRWSGKLEAPYTGAYQFATVSNDGVRLWVNGVLLIDNWVAHNTTTNTSAVVQLQAGQRYDIRVEHWEKTGNAVIRLQWKPPGTLYYVTVPVGQLHLN